MKKNETNLVGQHVEPGSNEVMNNYQQTITDFESASIEPKEREEYSPWWGKPSILKRSRPNVEDLFEYEEWS